jgi:hypothetical protein
MCWSKLIEMFLNIKDNGDVYVYFVFCCEAQVKVKEYPIDVVCADIDKCYNEVFKIATDMKICYNCNKYHGHDVTDMSLFSLQNGTSHICTQHCKFCGMLNTGRRISNPKYRECSIKILEAILRSKTITALAPSVSGDPFEDTYIRDYFLFNIHKTNIKCIDILTNGLHCDKEYLIKLRNYLCEHNITVGFSINVPGLTKEIYESGCNGDFELAKRNVKYMYELFGNFSNLHFFSITYITSYFNMNLTEKQINEQFKTAFPFLSIEKGHLHKSVDYMINGPTKEKIENDIFPNECDRLEEVKFNAGGKIVKYDIINKIYNVLYKSDSKCLDRSIQLFVKNKNDIPYVSFVFCNEFQTELISYPLNDVCKNFDEYIIKCIDALCKRNICSKCNHSGQFNVSDPKEYTISIGINHKCSQNCNYCGTQHICFDDKNIEYSNKLLKAISKSKQVYNFSPSCTGEPFEDLYIRDKFLFNLHKSNIKNIKLVTDAVNLNTEYIDKLYNYFKENNINCKFFINFSGLTKEIYGSYCNSDFESVKQNIKTIIERFGNENVTIVYVISRHNYLIKMDDLRKQFNEIFEELDFDKNLCIIHDWKNWKDWDRLKFTVPVDANCNDPIPHNLKSRITDKYQYNK